MQIVIKIPEWIYRRIQDIGLSDYPIINGTANAIRHGTVLPEHGRLIDADELFNEFCEIAVEPYINAPTILEATEGVE